MSNYVLSLKSRAHLIGVHPDLSKVVTRAIEITETDFGVLKSVRTLEEQKELFAKGRSTTLHSKHLKQIDGYSHAVDLFVLVNHQVSWEYKDFKKVIQAMFTAAIELNVQIKAGGLWRDFVDSPHFELNDNYY